MTIQHEVWGTTGDGAPVDLYTLTNAHGLEARIMTYGGIVVSLRTPDRDGTLADVTLGFDTFAPYLGPQQPYFGALIGRYGNRIARGTFTLDGTRYTLARNNMGNHLHGGVRGFDKVLWRADADAASAPRLTLSYRSADGEEGYPGTLDVMVVYTLTEAGELRIDYMATTDAPTIVNLTNHTYWNLGSGDDILGHEMRLFADRFIPVDETLIPLGEERAVAGTPMDFRAPTAIGAHIGDDEQLRLAAGGYDHTYVVNRHDGELAPVASVYEPVSGRTLDVFTTQPGVQFYSGNMLEGDIRGKGERVYGKYGGFCLETQHYPDSPNQPQFPSTVLRPHETYRQTTVYRFGVRG
jgi:aldose 1-epimerase